MKLLRKAERFLKKYVFSLYKKNSFLQNRNNQVLDKSYAKEISYEW